MQTAPHYMITKFYKFIRVEPLNWTLWCFSYNKEEIGLISKGNLSVVIQVLCEVYNITPTDLIIDKLDNHSTIRLQFSSEADEAEFMMKAAK